MDHRDHVDLLRPAEISPGGTWADLGSGSGAFTLALRELLGSGGAVYSVDKDRRSLDALARAYQARFGDTQDLHLIHADFTQGLDLPPLDGAVMANSLHYFKDKEKVLRHVRTLLKPGGALLLVEYIVDTANAISTQGGKMPTTVARSDSRAAAPMMKARWDDGCVQSKAAAAVAPTPAWLYLRMCRPRTVPSRNPSTFRALPARYTNPPQSRHPTHRAVASTRRRHAGGMTRAPILRGAG